MADRGDTSLWQQLLSSRAFQNQDMSNFDRDTALNLPKRRKKKQPIKYWAMQDMPWRASNDFIQNI